MTQAVCFNCGAIKFGSLTACKSCNKTPVSDDDMALSMACSEHYLDLNQLNGISAKIKSGIEITLNEQDKIEMIKEMQKARESNAFLKIAENVHRSRAKKVETSNFFKNILSLVVLLAMGVCFIAAVISLFSGEVFGAIGLLVLSAILNGVAKWLKA